jgi:hypothetical protein
VELIRAFSSGIRVQVTQHPRVVSRVLQVLDKRRPIVFMKRFIGGGREVRAPTVERVATALTFRSGQPIAAGNNGEIPQLLSSRGRFRISRAVAAPTNILPSLRDN